MQLINGNNIDILKQYPDNYFDSVATDPPYGLGKEPNAEELMKDWIEKGYHEVSGSGFMGKDWDAFVPQPIFWKEVFRVLKPGGHVLAFYGTRTYDWGVMAMRFAGFEVRDCIQWLYGSGFPKSHNISKAIDKMYGAEREVVGLSKNGAGASPQKLNNHDKGDTGIGILDGSGKEFDITAPATEQAREWEGWGSALKPANEPIVLVRKPLEKGLSIAENVLKWGVGAINIDGCRVGVDMANEGANAKRMDGKSAIWNNAEAPTTFDCYSKGRFPANLILTHHPECECVGTKKVKSDGHHSGKVPYNGGLYNLGLKPLEDMGNKYADENGEETIENWNCHDDCPIKILDEQSGESKSSNTKRNRNTIGSFGMPNDSTHEYADKGGASRFFYIAKASKSERNKGLEGFEAKQMAWSNQAKAELKRGNTEFADDTKMHNKVQERINFHPTVKPIELMQYLVRLVTPPNGIVLDPFCGSGTTGIACKLEGFQFVGLEQDAEYCKIAQARIDNYIEEKEFKKSSKPKENNNLQQPTLF